MIGNARERGCRGGVGGASVLISGLCSRLPTLLVWLQVPQQWTRSEELHHSMLHHSYFSVWGFGNSIEDFGARISMFVSPVVQFSSVQSRSHVQPLVTSKL